MAGERKDIADQIAAAASMPGAEELRKAILEHRVVNLVFEGGGAKGALYAGILKVLEEKGVYAGIRNIGGSSAGGIIAFLLAIGNSPEQVFRKVCEIDFKKLEGTSTLTQGLNLAGKAAAAAVGTFATKAATGASLPVSAAMQVASQAFNDSASPLGIGSAYALFSQNYLYEDDEFMKMAREFLTEKGKGFNENMTFEDHHKLVEEARQKGETHLKDMFLTGTNLDLKELQIFSHLDTPKVKLVDALRATMSFPFAFKPHPIEISPGKTYHFADGGIASNYPMEIFNNDQPDYGIRGKFFDDEPQLFSVGLGNKQRKINPCTLGCKVDSASERSSLLYSVECAKKLGVVGAADIISALMVNSDLGVRDYYQNATIQGHDMGMDTLNFALKPLEKLALVLSGYAAVQEYFQRREAGFPPRVAVADAAKRGEAPKVAQELIMMSNEFKALEAMNAADLFAPNKGVARYEKILTLLARIVADEGEFIGRETAQALKQQMAEMNWVSGVAVSKTISVHKDLNSLVDDYLTPAKADVGAQKRSPSPASTWGDLVRPAAFAGVGFVAGIASAGTLLPAFGVAAALGVASYKGQQGGLAPGAKLQHYHPVIKEFRKYVADGKYKEAQALFLENKGKNLTAPLALKIVHEHKATFKVLSIPGDCIALENLLIDRLAAQEIAPKENAEIQAIFLHYIEKGDTVAVKKLLINSAIDLTERDQHGQTPLVLAVYHNQSTLVKLLCQDKGDINQDYATALAKETSKLRINQDSTVIQMLELGVRRHGAAAAPAEAGVVPPAAAGPAEPAPKKPESPKAKS